MVEGGTGRPAPALAGLVDRYLGYRIEGHPPGIHRGLPSRHLALNISLTDPIDLTDLPAQAAGRFAAPLGGLHAAPVTIAHDGNQVGVSIDVTPLGARRLLGVPAGELASLVVDLGDVLGPAADELRERLVLSDGWDERFAVVDEVLTRQLVDAPAPPPEVVRAHDLVVATGGAIGVAELARHVGWSRRHLASRFATHLGVSPKALARIVRFQRSRRLLDRPDPPTVAWVAAECGFYDQAHLVRDWQDLAGCAPTTWWSDEVLPSVQDADGAFAR